MKKIIFILVTLILTNDLKSQPQEFNCGFTEPTGGNNSISNPFMGLYKPVRTDFTGDSSSPSGTYFPVIIVFVQFHNDINGFNWPSGQPPTYLDSLIANPEYYNDQSNWWDAYNENTQNLSDLYREISRGKMHMLGKAFSVVLNREAHQYTSEASINLEIWESLKVKIPDWKPYDLWQKGTDGKFRYKKDYFVDMIFKVHKSRAPVMFQKEGYSTLAYFGQGNVLVDANDTIYIDHTHSETGSGLTASFNGTRSDYLGTIKHEFAHFTIATHGHYTYSAVNYGLGRDSYSPYDMILSGYMVPKIFNFNTQTDFVLGDFSSRNNDTIGNVLKVPISGEEFFLISSRRKVSRWDRVMLGDTVLKLGYYSDNTEYGKGVYVYHIKNGIFHPSSDISPQDMECADGYWQWSDSPSGHHYQTVPTTCFESTPGWPYFNKLNPLYTNDQSIIENPVSVGDGQSFYHRYCYSTTNCGAWVKWWGNGEKEVNSCLVGMDRIYTNKNEIYSSLEAFGDRWDGWNVGNNEVFSPYSSPSTKNWNDSETGIFIWHYNQEGNDAKFEIYKASENGGTTSLAAILAATPPSRPMGIKIENYQSGSFCYPKIVWNHNSEPDMLRTGNLKRYEIYKATQSTISQVPTSYSLLSTTDIHDTITPSFVDLSVNKYDCTSTISLNDTIYPVRYFVKAVDNYNDKSVASDFAQTFGVKQGISDPIGPDNISLNPEIPKEYSLKQNYPNPFNPSTNIQFDLPEDNFVTIKIYDILGKEVFTLVNEFKEAGRYVVRFTGSNLSSGVYYYRIKSGGFDNVKRLVLIK